MIEAMGTEPVAARVAMSFPGGRNTSVLLWSVIYRLKLAVEDRTWMVAYEPVFLELA